MVMYAGLSAKDGKAKLQAEQVVQFCHRTIVFFTHDSDAAEEIAVSK